MSIERASSEQAFIIESMMVPYLAGLGGKAPYPHLDRYWQDEQRFPYLLRHGDAVVGFALVRTVGANGHRGLDEFYVKPEFRGRGLGRATAQALFASHRGEWRIAVRRDNLTGVKFWETFFSYVPSVRRAEIESPPGVVYSFRVHEASA